MSWQDKLKPGDQVMVPKAGGGWVRAAVLELAKTNNTVQGVVVGRTNDMDRGRYTPWHGKAHLARFARRDVRKP